MKQTYFILGGLMLLVSSARADVTVGTDPSSLIPPAVFDTCPGCLFAYVPVTAALNGQTLVSWSFYALTTNPVTPILYGPAAGPGFNLQVIGIGTMVTPSSTGVNTQAFGGTGIPTLVTGDYLGWRDAGTGPLGGSATGDGDIAITGDGLPGRNRPLH